MSDQRTPRRSWSKQELEDKSVSLVDEDHTELCARLRQMGPAHAECEYAAAVIEALEAKIEWLQDFDPPKDW